MPPAPVFIGFRVKRVSRDIAWLKESGGWASEVVEICSVSDCISRPPPDWELRWDFNRVFCYNTEAGALRTIPVDDADGYELFAYRMFPLEFKQAYGVEEIDLAKELGADLSPLPPEPDLSSYLPIGYDLAGGPYMDMGGGRESMVGFGCSPLSCNACAAEFRVNRYCLIDEVEAAIEAGRVFGLTEPEPGPFYLYQVLRKRSEQWPA